MTKKQKQERLLAQAKVEWLERELSSRAPDWVLSGLRNCFTDEQGLIEAIVWLTKEQFTVEENDDQHRVRLRKGQEILSTFVWSVK